MKRIAYIDKDLRTDREYYTWKEENPSIPWTESPSYKKAAKTVAHLEEIFEVDTFSELNEQTAAEIVENNGKTAYEFLITDLVKNPSDRALSYTRGISQYEDYRRNLMLLKQTAEQMPETTVVLYLTEAWDVVRFVFLEQGLEKVVQKKYDGVTKKDFWGEEMAELQEEMMKKGAKFKFDETGIGAFYKACRVLER